MKLEYLISLININVKPLRTLIQRRCDIIYSICELDDDGTIVSCSKDKSIIIGDQIIPKAHFCIICKVICLSGKRIASCS